jgi:hypothetical protein
MYRRGFASQVASCAYLSSRRMMGNTCTTGSDFRMPPLASTQRRRGRRSMFCFPAPTTMHALRQQPLRFGKSSVLVRVHIGGVGVGFCDGFENLQRGKSLQAANRGTTWDLFLCKAILFKTRGCMSTLPSLWVAYFYFGFRLPKTPSHRRESTEVTKNGWPGSSWWVMTPDVFLAA